MIPLSVGGDSHRYVAVADGDSGRTTAGRAATGAARIKGEDTRACTARKFIRNVYVNCER